MRKLIAIVAVAAALIAAGCGGERGNTAAAETTAAEREEGLLKFAQCMRSKGVDVPDPTTDSNGNLILRAPQGMAPGRPDDNSKERTAQRECRKHLAGAAQQFTPEQRAEMQDRMVKFAECMRSKGIDMPDPEFSEGSGPGTFRQRIRAAGVNAEDSKFREASDECREKVFAGQGGPGRGGVFFAPPAGQ